MIAIYARQSIEKKDSVSIETQIEKCIYYCDNQNYKIYKDTGFSGKNINRPQFSKLIDDIKKGLVKKVIAYRLDRISRSIADFSQLLIMFDEYDVDFISATENFDTNTPMGRAMINIVMTFAQLERETIVERVTDNYYFRANNGYWAGGHAPYGYKIKHIIGKDGKKQSILETDEEQTKIVKRIYDMYINQNMSIRKISQKLNEENIPTLKKGNWGINTISSILSRPIYTNATPKIYNYYHNLNANITNNLDDFDGSMTSNLYGNAKKNSKQKSRRSCSDMYLSLINCTPIISNENWFKAQKLKGTTRLLPPRQNTSKISFLCGLVKCGKCSSNMVTQGCKNRYGIQYYYLICGTKKNIGASKCNNKMIDVSKLEAIVIDDIKKHFNSKYIKKRIEKYLKNTKQETIHLLKNKEDLENTLIKIDIQIQNLINSLAEGNTTVSKYINQKIEDLETEKQNVILQLKALSNQNDALEDNQFINYVTNINNQLNTNDFEQLKTLCKTVINDIVITDKNIDIHYKI